MFVPFEKLFDENAIPFKNLISILLDSCKAMRGNKMDNYWDMKGSSYQQKKYINLAVWILNQIYFRIPDSSKPIYSSCFSTNKSYSLLQSLKWTKWTGTDVTLVVFMSKFSSFLIYSSGETYGFDTQVRNGESCHHINNVAKKFCSSFDNFLEHFFRDVYSDFLYSPDHRHYLHEVCWFIFDVLI